MAKITSRASLNVGTELTISTAGKTIGLNVAGNLVAKDGVSMQALYSKLVDLWNTATYNDYDFPMYAKDILAGEYTMGWNGTTYNGWTFLNDASRSYIRDAGWGEYNSSGVLQKVYVGLYGLGTLASSGSQPYYQISSGGAAANFTYTDMPNEAIKIYDVGAALDSRLYAKVYIRTYNYTYTEWATTQSGFTTTGPEKIPFVLNNVFDDKIQDTDVNVAANAPYTGITATWLAGNNFDTTNTSPYVVDDVVQDGAGRWYICTGNGTADVTDYADLSAMGGAGTATFSSYTGEREINGSYYAFNIIVDGNTASKEDIYTKLQYLSRQAGDIDSGAGSHLGKVTDVLANFAGSTLITTTGVYIDDTLTADSAFLTYTDVGGVQRSIPVVTTQSVTVTGPTAGSRIQIYDLTSSTELYNGTPTFPYTWTDPSVYAADREIRLRVAYVNAGTSANQFFSGTIGTATETAYALNYLFAPETDTVYAANAIDGSAVTDVVKNNATDRIEINKASGTISVAQLYAYEMYYLFTATGIAADPQVITAIDTANYLVANSWKFKNVTTGPNVALTITGGWVRDSSTLLSITTVDTTGYTLYNAPDHIVPFSTSSGVITGDVTDVITAIDALNDLSSADITAAVPSATDTAQEVWSDSATYAIGEKGRIIIDTEANTDVMQAKVDQL